MFNLDNYDFYCPACKLKLNRKGDYYECTNDDCKMIFPIVGNIPILLNEKNSLFRINDYTKKEATFYKKSGKFNLFIKKLIPSIDINLNTQDNLDLFLKKLKENKLNKRILIIGGGIEGHALNKFLKLKNIELIETDVSYGPRTVVICDGHDLPFKDEYFDGIIIQAVLEHVQNPFRVVSEIYRTLKQNGIVYSETPFMQQMHMVPYDFTRFTQVGLRCLYKKFDIISLGIVGGPGMALAQSFQYFLLSFVTGGASRKIIWIVSSYMVFWLKYFDIFLQKRKGAIDGASGYYFLGQKSNKELDIKDCLKSYSGAFTQIKMS